MTALRAGQDLIDREAVVRVLVLNNQQAHEQLLAAPLAAIAASLRASVPEALAAVRDATGAESLARLTRRLAPRVALRAAAPAVKSGGFHATDPAALTWIQRHAGELIKGIEDTTRADISALVDRAFTEGITVDDLGKDIGDLLDDPARGELIAQTETMTASNEGQREAWGQAVEEGLLTGNEKREWIVTPDDRLCEICEPMDGEQVGLNEMFDVDGEQIDGPPAHPRCLPGDALVTPGSRIAAQTKRWYQGDLVVLRTASGKQLACTPNHPILTRRGWMPARLAYVVGHVLSRRFGEREIAWGHHDDEHVPARVEQIARAFRQARQVAAVPMPVAAEDFHGDGRGSEVAVVWANRLLRDRRHAEARQPRGQAAFFAADMEAARLDRLRVLDLRRQRDGASPRCRMCGRHLRAAFGRRVATPLQAFGLRLGPHPNSRLAEHALNGRPGDTVGARQGQNRFAGAVSTHEVVNGKGMTKRPTRFARVSQDAQRDGLRDAELARQIVRGAAGEVFPDDVLGIDVIAFAGHVYNLQTETGSYIADGIVSHNCRCTEGLAL